MHTLRLPDRVTKLGKMSIFSGLNNLNDISMDLRYADICGISESELQANFDASVEELAAVCGLAKEKCYAKLARMYDGYHFHPKAIGVYNPFSLLNTFYANEFRMYWFQTELRHSSFATFRPGDTILTASQRMVSLSRRSPERTMSARRRLP